MNRRQNIGIEKDTPGQYQQNESYVAILKSGKKWTLKKISMIRGKYDYVMIIGLYLPLESPCSPIIQPWQLAGWTPNFSPIR